MIRRQLVLKDFEDTIDTIENEWRKRLLKHGDGLFINKHEALGVITEEFFELTEAIRNNENDRFKEELIDVIIACAHALNI